MAFRILTITLLCTLATSIGGALEIGQPVGELNFKDIRYIPRSLADFGPREAFVIGFSQLAGKEHGPLAESLATLQGEVSKQSVEVALMNVGVSDTTLSIAHDGILRDLPFTLLRDLGESAAGLGAKTMGTVVILDENHTLRYRGDMAGARAALKALLANSAIDEPERAVEGAPITAMSAPAAKGNINYNEHIAGILDTHCVSCHRPGQGAPFSLRNYRQAATRADMITEVVLEERMPPWYGVRSHGPFANERLVSPAEKNLLRQWVAAGKPEGDPALRPEAPEFPDSEWAIGEPDLVITMAEEQSIPAEGYIPYRYITLPYQFSDDTWIQGLEILPSNPEVVHHANLIYTQVGEGYSEKHNFLTGKVPGGSPVDLSAPVGMMIPKASVLTLQIHYVTTGQPEKDRIRVGIRYARGTVIKQTHHQRIRPDEIKIPPGEAFHRMSAEETIGHNATVLALFSHLHLRGRDMTFFADYPDGKSETLLTIPNYSFDWQLAYVYEPGQKRFPKGTKIRTVSHYDNSAFNPYNPDPTDEVRYGDQTYHEMNDGYIFYLDEDEFLNIKVDPKTGHAMAG